MPGFREVIIESRVHIPNDHSGGIRLRPVSAVYFLKLYWLRRSLFLRLLTHAFGFALFNVQFPSRKPRTTDNPFWLFSFTAETLLSRVSDKE